MHSSPFDVLEYGLASGDLPKRLPLDQAAMWVFCLAELVDCTDFLSYHHRYQAYTLHECARGEGIVIEREGSWEIARLIVYKYGKISEIIRNTDNRDSQLI